MNGSDQFQKGRWQLIFLAGEGWHRPLCAVADDEAFPIPFGEGQPVDVGGLWLLLKVVVPSLEHDDLVH